MSGWSSSDEEQEQGSGEEEAGGGEDEDSYCFPKLEQQLTDAIADLGGAVFRTGLSAPRDAAFLAEGPHAKHQGTCTYF